MKLTGYSVSVTLQFEEGLTPPTSILILTNPPGPTRPMPLRRALHQALDEVFNNINRNYELPDSVKYPEEEAAFEVPPTTPKTPHLDDGYA